jgi:hypothetical protein
MTLNTPPNELPRRRVRAGQAGLTFLSCYRTPLPFSSPLAQTPTLFIFSQLGLDLHIRARQSTPFELCEARSLLRAFIGAIDIVRLLRVHDEDETSREQ